MMGIGCWVHCWGDASEQQKDLLAKAMVRHGIEFRRLLTKIRRADLEYVFSTKSMGNSETFFNLLVVPVVNA